MVTPFEYKVLLRVGSQFLHGSAEVGAARRLQKKGLVVLEDRGHVRGEGAFQQLERWWATLTPRGKEWLERDEKRWQEAMAWRP